MCHAKSDKSDQQDLIGRKGRPKIEVRLNPRALDKLLLENWAPRTLKDLQSEN